MSSDYPFADPDDVAAVLLRPLTILEQQYVPTLIEQAAALLQNAAPSIDVRVARYAADPTDPAGVSPGTVTAVVSGAVKRYMVNPEGIASTSQTVGPYSKSTSYALRSEKERRGALEITSDDLAVLFPTRRRIRAGTIRTRAALAPRPVGRYGPLQSIDQAVDAEITFADRVDTLDAQQPWPQL